MPADAPLRVVLCWHMHQPDYRDQRSGEFHLPWTYLHVMKDYVDMAAHLESNPEARAVVNFSPVLLDQIDDYATQIKAFLFNSGVIRDSLLAALADPALPAEVPQGVELVKKCLKAHRTHQINRFPAYKKLAAMADWVKDHPDAMKYLNSQFLGDLLVWYHLAWLGETVRRSDPRVKNLISKASGYTLHDRRELLQVIERLLSSVIDRYRALAETGQVELSVTPYAHPIMPLLLDIQCAREAMPDIRMPLLEHYPGGKERVLWHLSEGIASFQRHFGFTPLGCWPSEGSVSEPILQLLSEQGFRWAASGGSVLENSLKTSGFTNDQSPNPYQPFRFSGTKLSCFFRDDGLSDLIGFTYADWHADDAVNDLIVHLKRIASANKPGRVVSIIMDGENAWEHYPENAYYFLSTLYQKLGSDPDIELSTFSQCLEQQSSIPELRQLVAGSWVYGTFSTWLGDSAKNRAWDMLGDAKRCFDRAIASNRFDPDRLDRAEHQLAVCECSDWFWWFGDYNPEETVGEFERLYRLNLASIYQILGEEPPPYLTEVFTHGSGAPLKGGTMRPGKLHHDT